MEHNPWLRTTPALAPVLRELRDREPLFHRFGPSDTLETADALISEIFWETGASGARYDRQTVLRVLAERLREPGRGREWHPSEWAVRELSPELFLLTYTLDEPARRTRRTTIWRRHEGEWSVEYHQGTVVAP
ncbi:MAG TPA: DUF4440 domain-containing protein [Solirubrobacteraceae bacterium]|jgi:hypothetical protein|nr:DUF4440 domain-containing protein [Solirubrobacteraceae bacterium]